MKSFKNIAAGDWVMLIGKTPEESGELAQIIKCKHTTGGEIIASVWEPAKSDTRKLHHKKILVVKPGETNVLRLNKNNCEVVAVEKVMVSKYACETRGVQVGDVICNVNGKWIPKIEGDMLADVVIARAKRLAAESAIAKIIVDSEGYPVLGLGEVVRVA